METVRKTILKKPVLKKAISKTDVAGNKTITATIARRIQEVETKNWIYVSPSGNTWTVRKDGAKRALHIYKLKESAINAAKKISQPFLDKHIIVYNLQGEVSKII